MKFCFVLFLSFLALSQAKAQVKPGRFEKDSMILVAKDVAKGFHFEYILFIPKGTPRHQPLFLVVEPNNSGKLSDSIEVHRASALRQASVNSIGNNISTELKIPLLVPVFPRPASKELVYTHALDRDVMAESSGGLQRLDLQLIAMIRDGREILDRAGVVTNEKIFMNGFSASGTFTNRFSLLHPHLVKALAIGGFNGELMLPLPAYRNRTFNYPLGINDLKNITRDSFHAAAYKAIPQYIYMGALDQNDAVQFDDAYNAEEREIINTTLGSEVQARWQQCQQLYQQEKVNAIYKTYENVGHETTSRVNLDIILFFMKFLKEESQR